MPRLQKVGPYKKYLRDPNIPIPRSTVWYKKTQQRQQENIYNDVSRKHEYYIINLYIHIKISEQIY